MPETVTFIIPVDTSGRQRARTIYLRKCLNSAGATIDAPRGTVAQVDWFVNGVHRPAGWSASVSGPMSNGFLRFDLALPACTSSELRVVVTIQVP